MWADVIRKYHEVHQAQKVLQNEPDDACVSELR